MLESLALEQYDGKGEARTCDRAPAPDRVAGLVMLGKNSSVNLCVLLAAVPLLNCLRTITEVGATGGTTTEVGATGGTSAGASSGTGSGASGTGTGGSSSGDSSSGASSSGGSSSGSSTSSGGPAPSCRGMPDGPPCSLPDGGLGNCYGETCQVIDFSSDPQNCGRYGLRCPPPAVCTDYLCFEPGAGAITCMDGKTQCQAGQVCVPFEGCVWQGCDPGLEDQICVLDPMVCTPDSCATQGVCCQSSCLNTFDTDPFNCGDCGVTCQDGGICVEGQCRIPDPSCGPNNNNALCVTSTGVAGACCFSECVDNNTDVLDCGGCGTACPIGASCEDGFCVGDGGGHAGCGTFGPSVCPAGTSCSWELFISPCFPTSCAPGSNGITCVLDGGMQGACCGGVCGGWSEDAGCSG